MHDMMTIIHSCKVALYQRKVPVTQESFNASELNKAVRNGGIIINRPLIASNTDWYSIATSFPRSVRF